MPKSRKPFAYPKEVQRYTSLLDKIFENISDEKCIEIFHGERKDREPWDGSVLFKYIADGINKHSIPDFNLKLMQSGGPAYKTVDKMPSEGLRTIEYAKIAFFFKADYIKKSYKLFLADYVRFCYGRGKFVPKAFEGFEDEVNELKAYYGGQDQTEIEFTHPGFIRGHLDRIAPTFHNFLVHWGILSRPKELKAFREYIDDQIDTLDNELSKKTYQSLSALDDAMPPVVGDPKDDRPVPRFIRQVLEVAKGGDAFTPQIAAIHKDSTKVKSLVKVLLGAKHPLILLGDPGTGKTWTLKETMLKLLESERRRVYPKIVLEVRVSEFFVEEGDIKHNDVFAHVYTKANKELKPFLNELKDSGRLVIIFDGMDEMSRKRYAEHTSALSRFANRRNIQTLFSCRITDFSPEFTHRKLILLSFSQTQIREFLKRNFGKKPGWIIDNRSHTNRSLAKMLAREKMSIDPTIPFILWLLCYYLRENKCLPAHRVELLYFYNKDNYKRIAEEGKSRDYPPHEEAFQAWAEIAFRITERNRGPKIPLTTLNNDWQPSLPIEEAVQIGVDCGVLVENFRDDIQTAEFEHKRSQEFFAALYIHQESPPINWLDKLDAERWRETMLNTILFGKAPEAISALEHSILEPIKALEAKQSKIDSHPKRWNEPSTAKFDKDEEESLADRVELAARLILKGGKALKEKSVQLSKIIEEGIKVLIERGNPISQVKMIQAYQHLPDIDHGEAMIKPLESKVAWVRNQSYTVLVAAPGKKSFISLLAYGLAKHNVIDNLKGYINAALHEKQYNQLLFVLLAAFLHAVAIVFPVTMGIVISKYAVIQQFGQAVTELLGNWWLWLSGALTVAALVVGWTERKFSLLIISLLTPILLTTMMIVFSYPWFVWIPEFWSITLGTILNIAIFSLHLIAIFMVWHMFCLSLFLGSVKVAGLPVADRKTVFRALREQTYIRFLNKQTAPLLLLIPVGLTGIALLVPLVVAIAGAAFDLLLDAIDWYQSDPQIIKNARQQLEHMSQAIIKNAHEWGVIFAAVLAIAITLIAIVKRKAIAQCFHTLRRMWRVYFWQYPWMKPLMVWIAGIFFVLLFDQLSRAASVSVTTIALVVALWKQGEFKSKLKDKPFPLVQLFVLLFVFTLIASRVAAGGLLVGGIVWILCIHDRSRWTDKSEKAVLSLAKSLSALAAIAIAGLSLNLVATGFETWASSLLKETWPTILKPVLTGIIVIVVSIIFIRFMFYLIKPLGSKMKRHVPKNLTVEDWKTAIRTNWRDSKIQHAFLQVDRHALGLSPQDYLNSLEDLQDCIIDSDPALSTYWHKRHEAKESIRQEGKG